MKVTGISGLILLMIIGLAPALVAETAEESQELTPVAEALEGTACEAAATVPMSKADFVSWAETQGFEVSTDAKPVPLASAPPPCPPIISCNSTHCVETQFCAITNFGSSSCTSGPFALICPAGTTIKVRRCRCAGGGCLVPNSQTFFCL